MFQFIIIDCDPYRYFSVILLIPILLLFFYWARFSLSLLLQPSFSVGGRQSVDCLVLVGDAGWFPDLLPLWVTPYGMVYDG